jgi:TRAP-type mannitol/chloroaromatic compound transport system permease small subunit
MNRLLHRLMHGIDAISEWSGHIVSWLVVVLVGVICYDVFMRYAFREGSVALQELQWHLFAVMFLMAAAYTFKHDEHVRVDIVFSSRLLTDRQRAWINILGVLLMLAPFCLLIIFSSLGFVKTSYMIGEGSPDPGGLEHRYLLKTTIPLGFGLLMLQGVGEVIRNALFLRGHITTRKDAT